MRIVILLEIVAHIIVLAMYINGKATVGELMIVAPICRSIGMVQSCSRAKRKGGEADD